ncbi:MAG: 6-phosphofructokinase [Opitutales bacterium]
MAEELIGNVLVAQSGGPTAVINASLAGVITEALSYECVEEIYGGLNGVLGILQEDFVDLAEETQQTIRGLRYTPSSALGTCRYKLRKDRDYQRVIEVFQAHNIRYFFYIGGNDSQDSTAKISAHARESGWEMRCIGILIKHVASTVRDLSKDAAAMGQHDMVYILEVMGRNAGWIAAGASLAKRRDHPEDPPHLIYLPEVAFDTNKFLEDTTNVLKTHRYCIVVVGEGLIDESGNYISTSSGATDSFGHSQLGGAANYLKGLLDQHVEGIKVRVCTPGHSQRCAALNASQTDNDEAFMVGQAAVKAALSGVTDKMITLMRGDEERYTCHTGLADLEEVANGVKHLPANWINEDGVSMNYQFVKYASPLIQGEVEVPRDNGLPAYIELSKRRVERILPPHDFE